jgi:tRNA pseudouridine38-40 synthase
MRIRAVVAYDGTGYHGFQRQSPEAEPTIQGMLEGALSRIEQSGRVIGAGRTDAGVHASGQVVAFDVNWRHALIDLHRALNAVLPDSIAVLNLNQAADDFHPRYDALSRTYRYSIYRAEVRHPLRQRYALHVSHWVNVPKMNRAAAALIGEHDFAAFGQPTAGESTVRNVLRAEVSAEGSNVWIDLEANAFLYRMVRRIVGTLLSVGREEISEAEFVEVLASADPDRAGPAVPPQGLCLTKVNYAGD